MIKEYNHKETESKWQQKWQDLKLFQHTFDKRTLDSNKKKNYLLFAFAYPSGEGLHVGHVESKTALDILARYYRMKGEDVFFPVGWDAFGLPAENYAVKTKIPPAETTKKAINTFRRQIKNIGISYDWESEIATCHPEYYKWTQWLFLELYKHQMAYKKVALVNWCPSCNTVLANEQVVDGKCERCGTEVIQKNLDQWFFKITDYNEDLIAGLDRVDWPESTRQKQLNWIGKKTGININYKVDEANDEIICFTTRPDTNFGATFVVLAPEHEFAQKIARGDLIPTENAEKVKSDVSNYINETSKKTELQRQQEGKKKTGAFTGFYAVNNLTGKKMPIWVSDFVLSGFGTGAVVGVPGHDIRDFEFANAFGIEVIRVVVGSDGDTSPITKAEQVQEESGTMFNSDFLNGMDIHAATSKIMDHMEEHGQGKRVISYRLRDWLISRQRYWGAPIPIVYDPEGKAHPVKEEHLPWLLPTDVDFLPTGEAPSRLSKEFRERVERLYGKGWTPDFDTMDTFVDSSWYYLRYTDPRNEKEFASKEQMKIWNPVDFYMIGPEHTVLHLLYSRFFTKFLRDHGYLTFDEPFLKMRHQGMILGPDGKKMSKSKGNVINPDIILDEYGADTLRVYEMFMGPIDADKPWDTNGVAGIKRFLVRAWNLVVNTEKSQAAVSTPNMLTALHKTVKKVDSDIKDLKYNTAIAKMMEFLNEWEKADSKMSKEDTSVFIRILAPFAPFITEEMWIELGAGSKDSIHLETWPSYDDSLTQDSTVTIAVQVNGKLRGTLPDIAVGEDQSNIETKAKALIAHHLDGKEILKVVHVPNRVVSFVVKQ